MVRRRVQVTSRDVAALLSGTVGWEKSTEAVSQAIQRLGLDGQRLDERDVTDVLDVLAGTGGIVGVTARFVRSRPLPFRPDAPVVEPAPVERTATVPKAPARLARAQLVALLAPTVGVEKAEEVLSHACKQLGLGEATFSLPEAHRVFEALASHDGLVGVTARFAKARLSLQSTG